MFPNNLRPRILENKRNWGKSQNWMVWQRSAQSRFQNLIFGNSDQKLDKDRYQSFLILFHFAWFILYLAQVCLYKQSSNDNILSFCVTSRLFSGGKCNCKANKFRKSFKFDSFLWALFEILFGSKTDIGELQLWLRSMFRNFYRY